MGRKGQALSSIHLLLFLLVVFLLFILVLVLASLHTYSLRFFFFFLEAAELSHLLQVREQRPFCACSHPPAPAPCKEEGSSIEADVGPRWQGAACCFQPWMSASQQSWHASGWQMPCCLPPCRDRGWPTELTLPPRKSVGTHNNPANQWMWVDAAQPSLRSFFC